MFIVNQDRDKRYRAGKVYYRNHFAHESWMGWNIYGRKMGIEKLLGTYDTEDDARQITNEIHLMKSKGTKEYAMPEAALTLDEMGVAL